jgi:hypothetical protein
MKKPPAKFPKRVVLATGYPWANGVSPYYEVCVREQALGGGNLQMKWPEVLWDPRLPKYRLVLERVKP